MSAWYVVYVDSVKTEISGFFRPGIQVCVAHWFIGISLRFVCVNQGLPSFDIIMIIQGIVRLNTNLAQEIEPQRYEKYSIYAKST